MLDWWFDSRYWSRRFIIKLIFFNLFKKQKITNEDIERYRRIRECESEKRKQVLTDVFDKYGKYIKKVEITDAPKTSPKVIFSDIVGYDNVKKVIKSMLMSASPVSILMDGSPGTGKSMFLHDINKFYPHNSVYVNGSKVTKAGLFKVLFEDENNNIRFLLINELDKVDYDTQETLLDLLEEGILSETMKTETRQKRYENLSVFATSNEIDNILEPLQTRFFKIRIKPYSKEQFTNIGQKVLQNKDLSQRVIDHIIAKVLEKKPEPNIRDVIQIGKLCNNDISIVDTLIELSDYD